MCVYIERDVDIEIHMQIHIPIHVRRHTRIHNSIHGMYSHSKRVRCVYRDICVCVCVHTCLSTAVLIEIVSETTAAVQEWMSQLVGMNSCGHRVCTFEVVAPETIDSTPRLQA